MNDFYMCLPPLQINNGIPSFPFPRSFFQTLVDLKEMFKEKKKKSFSEKKVSEK